MYTVSLQQLLEEASANHELEFYSGHIKDLEKAFTPENFALLDQEHDGLFAFLAFDYDIDKAVAGYVDSGTLGDDAGPGVMALYLGRGHARFTTGTPSAVDGMELNRSRHPAREAVRILFAPHPAPAMPGIVFVPRMSVTGEATYVDLSGPADAKAVRDRLRTVFATAEHVWHSAGHQGFTRGFGAELGRRKVPCVRSQRVSLPELLRRTARTAIDHRSEILAAVASLGGLLK